MHLSVLCGLVLLLLLMSPLPSKAAEAILSSVVPVLNPTCLGPTHRTGAKVSEQVWSETKPAGGFQLVGLRGSAKQKTEVRVCYDQENLYVRFECWEDKMDQLVTQFAQDQDPVWQDDSVELFISPYCVSGKSRTHQFVVNAAGAKTYVRPDWVRPSDNWRAAAVKLPDRWVADIIIPFDTLKPLGKNDDCWRVNFCRNEHPNGEVSSWSAVKQWFATFSRFGKLVPPARAPFSFNTFRGVILPLAAPPSAPVGTSQVEGSAKEIGAADCVIPEPQEVRRRPNKGRFCIASDTRIVINDAAGEADMWAVEELNDAIQRLGGGKLETIPASVMSLDAGEYSNVILLGENAANRAVKAVCQRDAVRAPRSRFGTSGHVIDVLPGRIVVAGQSQTDTYYAVQTLKQLIKADSNGALYIPSVQIRDFPRFTFRGAHLLASQDALRFLGKLIENVLAPMKVNHIVLQTDKVQWKSHPEVTDPKNSMTQEDVKALIEIARRHHIAVTPLVQSPGHIEWAFRNRNNIEFAEDPSRPYCYCMSNPKSYDFIFDIMDEAIELFGHPEYFHAGRDEFDMLGNMPVDERCKAIGKQRLYMQDTLRVYEHLKSKGCKMMMWGDILTKPGFSEMIDELPKDILINDWRYSPSETYPSLDFYRQHKLTTVGCTWYEPRNIAGMSIYAGKCGIAGMMQTTWTGFEPEAVVFEKWPEQVYSYILSAAWAWNPARPAVNDLPYRPDSVFHKMWEPSGRDKPSEYRTVNLGRYCNISRADSGRAIGWLGQGRGSDLRAIPKGTIFLEGIPYSILGVDKNSPSAIMLGASGQLDALPRSVENIQIGSKAHTLHFLQGCAFGVGDDEEVGSYIVRYEDGQTETIPLRYGKDIFAWDDQSMGLTYGFAWKGKTQDGRSIGVCDMSWTNPKPTQTIASIDFKATQSQASPFAIAITAELAP